MWAPACELIDQAERLHRQYFRPAAVQQAYSARAGTQPSNEDGGETFSFTLPT